MNGNGGQAMPRSGLILPTATLDKTEHIIGHADFVKLRRLMAWARQHGMKALYFCDRCQAPVALRQDTAVTVTDAAPRPPRIRLECACSRWLVR